MLEALSVCSANNYGSDCLTILTYCCYLDSVQGLSYSACTILSTMRHCSWLRPLGAFLILMLLAPPKLSNGNIVFSSTLHLTAPLSIVCLIDQSDFLSPAITQVVWEVPSDSCPAPISMCNGSRAI